MLFNTRCTKPKASKLQCPKFSWLGHTHKAWNNTIRTIPPLFLDATVIIRSVRIQQMNMIRILSQIYTKNFLRRWVTQCRSSDTWLWWHSVKLSLEKRIFHGAGLDWVQIERLILRCGQAFFSVKVWSKMKNSFFARFDFYFSKMLLLKSTLTKANF